MNDSDNLKLELQTNFAEQKALKNYNSLEINDSPIKLDSTV